MPSYHIAEYWLEQHTRIMETAAFVARVFPHQKETVRRYHERAVAALVGISEALAESEEY